MTPRCAMLSPSVRYGPTAVGLAPPAVVSSGPGHGSRDLLRGQLCGDVILSADVPEKDALMYGMLLSLVVILGFDTSPPLQLSIFADGFEAGLLNSWSWIEPCGPEDLVLDCNATITAPVDLLIPCADSLVFVRGTGRVQVDASPEDLGATLALYVCEGVDLQSECIAVEGSCLSEYAAAPGRYILHAVPGATIPNGVTGPVWSIDSSDIHIASDVTLPTCPSGPLP